MKLAKTKEEDAGLFGLGGGGALLQFFHSYATSASVLTSSFVLWDDSAFPLQ